MERMHRLTAANHLNTHIITPITRRILVVTTTLHNSFSLTFPDFTEQNESFSLTNLFMRNTSVGFQSLVITLQTMATKQIYK